MPRCAHCRGWLKPATVSVGQALPDDVLRDALALAEESDCFLALGSSLLVNPAASLAGVAKRRGAALIVVTLGDTPYDDVADVVIRGRLAEVLPRIAALVLDRA